MLALGVLEACARCTSPGPQPGADRRLYVRASLIVAPSAAAARGRRPRPLVFAAVLLAVAGSSLGGMATDVPHWLLALGLLIEALPVQRIVTAMVVWSRIGIIGYLLGPLAGGLVADRLGYTFIDTVPVAAGLLVLVLLHTAGSPVAEAAAEGLGWRPGEWSCVIAPSTG